VELQVLNESGMPVKPGEVGEIWAWGDNISPGYLNHLEATQEKFINGGLRTGDLATVDDEGYIYVVDRKSDFIKSSGHRISSQEIESRIVEIPDVVSAAVVGVQDPNEGEIIKAFVVLRKGSQLHEEDVQQYCRENMARYMVPSQVVLVDNLPTNAHGKVVKSLLKQGVEQAHKSHSTR
jgi:acyl-coenzyme A synthetase/AMP-(fatty) acid ligase